MAKLNQKFVIQNSQGQEQELDIYTTVAEATNENKYIQLQIPIEGKATTCYIGLTRDLDTLKASDMYVLENEDEWRARKYMGIKSFSNYMKNTYPDTYQTMTELPEDFPDASDSTTMQQCFDGCKKIIKYPHLDTRNSTNFQTMFRWNEDATEFPVLNTSKGTNFSTMYAYCSSGLNFPTIDTSNGESLSAIYQGCSSGVSFPKLNTSKNKTFQGFYLNCKSAINFPQLDTKLGNNFIQMYDGCSLAEKVSDIDLSSISFNDISTKFVNMLRNCTSLLLITFNNVPQGVTEEQLRTATGAPSTCQIIINYRQIKPQTPIRIIKAENMKLVDIDVNGDMPIIREGNKPLDEYIVNSGDWGTIYDDGKNFKCFITKDNKIYCGKGYNSTNRDPSYQPEIPEGIEVPNGNLTIEMGKFEKVGDFSVIGVGIEKYVNINFFRFLSVFISAVSLDNNISWVSNKEDGIFDCIARGNLNGQRIYETGTKELPEYYGSNLLGGQYIKVANYKDREPQSFKQINIYEGTPFWEELENELNKIKGMLNL